MAKHAKATESPDSEFRHDKGNNFYDPDIARTNPEYDDLGVVCPSHTTERRLMTKIDLRVIPVLSVLYLLAFLDRTNIANAAVYGLSTDLGLVSGSNQYNTALTIFFVPYIVSFRDTLKHLSEKAQAPYMAQVPPDSPFDRNHLQESPVSGCMFVFGLVTICQGLVKGYSGILATRFFLGVAETGMFPGSFYLIGMWYKRSEAQKRYSFFFSSTTLAGAFGGLLAAAIGNMNGMRGYLAWRWIFIIEGVVTCVVAIIFFFLIPSFPEDASWLTDEERAYVKARLQADQGRSAAERNISFKDVRTIFKDYKIFIGGFMYFGLIVPAYSYAFFAPGIIKSYGYSAIQTQLHSVPPWATAFGFAMIVAFFSDTLKHRFIFTLLPICVSITGFAILLTVHTNHQLEYAALFLVTSGTYGAMPVVVCWFTQNLGGHHRRAVGTAWQIGFGNIGGIIATYAFLSTDAPEYKMGYAICISFVCLSAASCLTYFVSVWTQNRSRDRAGRDLGLTEWEKTEKGDMSPDYRYQL
ncbi:hypothetical protein MMC18_008285 [Xylographa bjoerkii]|nr:hypothetical protein [Xylographa bjoerkii]